TPRTPAGTVNEVSLAPPWANTVTPPGQFTIRPAAAPTYPRYITRLTFAVVNVRLVVPALAAISSMTWLLLKFRFRFCGFPVRFTATDSGPDTKPVIPALAVTGELN